jgi:hypothetical protein
MQALIRGSFYPRTMLRQACAGLLAGMGCVATLAWAQAPGVPVAQDRPYPGVIELRVDATDVNHRMLRVQERIPVRTGTLQLLFPRWLPGTHGPYAEPSQFAGLIVRDGDRFRVVRIDYRGGLRYPKLERIEGSRDWHGAILAPRS